MPYKKKAIPGTVQFNKLIAELPKKQKRTGSIQTLPFRITTKC